MPPAPKRCPCAHRCVPISPPCCPCHPRILCHAGVGGWADRVGPLCAGRVPAACHGGGCRQRHSLRWRLEQARRSLRAAALACSASDGAWSRAGRPIVRAASCTGPGFPPFSPAQIIFSFLLLPSPSLPAFSLHHPSTLAFPHRSNAHAATTGPSPSLSLLHLAHALSACASASPLRRGTCTLTLPHYCGMAVPNPSPPEQNKHGTLISFLPTLLTYHPCAPCCRCPSGTARPR